VGVQQAQGPWQAVVEQAQGVQLAEGLRQGVGLEEWGLHSWFRGRILRVI
jgi:hypothetical protein